MVKAHEFKPYALLGLVGLVVLPLALSQLWRLLPATGYPPVHAHGPHGNDEHVESAVPRGPRGGMLFEDRDLTLELLRRNEAGQSWLVAYAVSQGRAMPAAELSVKVVAGGHVLEFRPEKGHFVSLAPLHGESHGAWDLEVAHAEHRHAWQYDGDAPPGGR